MPRAPQSSKAASVRPYYIFTAVVFGIGMVLSVFAESWSSFFVFAVLCLTFVWVAARVSPPAPADPSQGARRMRPSERRRQRKQQG